jgi:hypothetical protein
MPKSPNDDAVVERFRVALDLYETGEAMMRHRIRRQNPDLDEVAVEERLQAWLQARPGAEYGDTVGRPVPWPRVPRP